MTTPASVEDYAAKDIKAAEVAHIDDGPDHALKEKADMAVGHEELEKTLSLWQNVKLYRKVSSTSAARLFTRRRRWFFSNTC